MATAQQTVQKAWITSRESQEMMGVDSHGFASVVRSGLLLAKQLPGCRRMFSRASVEDAIRKSIGIADNPDHEPAEPAGK